MVSLFGKSIFSLNLNPTPLKLRLSGPLLISYLLLWNTITSGTGRSEPTLKTPRQAHHTGYPHSLKTAHKLTVLLRDYLVPRGPQHNNVTSGMPHSHPQTMTWVRHHTNRATLTMKRNQAPAMPSSPLLPCARAPRSRLDKGQDSPPYRLQSRNQPYSSSSPCLAAALVLTN